MRQRMRDTVRNVTHTSIETYKDLSVELLNCVLLDENYWKTHMIPTLRQKFEHVLPLDDSQENSKETSEESSASSPLRQQLISSECIVAFVHRVEELTGVKLNTETVSELSGVTEERQMELVYTDIEKISVRVKFMVCLTDLLYFDLSTNE